MLSQTRLAPDELYKREYPKSLHLNSMKYKEFVNEIRKKKTAASYFKILCHSIQLIKIPEGKNIITIRNCRFHLVHKNFGIHCCRHMVQNIRLTFK